MVRRLFLISCSRATSPTALTRRGDRPNIPPTISSTASLYTIDLRQPAGSRIVDLRLADGTPVTDDMPIRLGMNSYRMGHLTQKGGALEGQSFPVLFGQQSAIR